MKNSLRISTFIVALVIVVAGVQSSFASATRMTSFGLDASSYWMIQKDTTTTGYFPSYGVQFAPLIAITPGDTTPGASMFLKPMDNLEIWLATGSTVSDGTAATPTYGNFTYAPTAMVTGTAVTNLTNMSRENYGALAAYKMGNMGFGARVGLADASYVNKTSDSNLGTSTKKDYAKTLQYFLLGFDMDMGAMGVDVGLKYTMYDYAGKTANFTDASNFVNTKYTAAPADTAIYARLNMALSEISKMHVFLGYTMVDRGDKFKTDTMVADVLSSTTNKSTHTGTVTLLGVSNEMKFAQNAFAYFGFLYAMNAFDLKKTSTTDGVVGSTDKTTYTADTLSLYMGTQASLTKNLSGCMGISRAWDVNSSAKNKITNTTTTTKNDTDAISGSTAPKASMGVVYQWGHFTIEANLNTALLTKGPYFVSGNTNDMAGSVNIVYAFGRQAALDEEKK